MTQQHDPIAHWPLATDARDAGPAGLAGQLHGVTFGAVDGRAAGRFNGVDSAITVADHPRLRLGAGDFTVTLEVNAAGDVVGDLVSKFDPDARCGFNLIVHTHTGVTQTTQSNYRHLQFGIDAARIDPQWTDCGRPGNAVKVSSLASIAGDLYAGTFELDADACGHLWRYEADGQWADLGPARPRCNNVGSIAMYEGKVHVATGRYNPTGSLLGNPQNIRPGGPVYRIEDDGRWTDIGHPGKEGAAPDDINTATYHSDQADETNCLTVFKGRLYASSQHRTGLYRYVGNKQWKQVGLDLRVMSLTIHAGNLYALINGGGVYRHDDDNQWTYCGDPPRSTQTYCAVTYQGALYVGTWPECEIIRYDGGEQWTKIGRIGYEREVMATALYNGKCYFGTLPMANVFRMDGKGFTFMGNLDNDPTVCLRRVWSMAVHDGQMFAGTLPGGRVLRRSAGRMATADRALPTGWRHIAAVRSGGVLRLYVDGQPIAASAAFDDADYNLDTDQPLRLGCGIGHVLNGAMRDVRLYNHALTPAEIAAAAEG